MVAALKTQTATLFAQVFHPDDREMLAGLKAVLQARGGYMSPRNLRTIPGAADFILLAHEQGAASEELHYSEPDDYSGSIDLHPYLPVIGAEMRLVHFFRKVLARADAGYTMPYVLGLFGEELVAKIIERLDVCKEVCAVPTPRYDLDSRTRGMMPSSLGLS